MTHNIQLFLQWLITSDYAIYWIRSRYCEKRRRIMLKYSVIWKRFGGKKEEKQLFIVSFSCTHEKVMKNESFFFKLFSRSLLSRKSTFKSTFSFSKLEFAVIKTLWLQWLSFWIFRKSSILVEMTLCGLNLCIAIFTYFVCTYLCNAHTKFSVNLFLFESEMIK
jgi:hypothetical protein